MLSYYRSDLVLGYGRFIVITSSQQIEDCRDTIVETFVFGFDTQGIFESYRNIIAGNGIEFVQQEALTAVRNIIHKYQQDKYRETKDSEYINNDINFYEFKEADENVIILLKNKGYRQKLEQIERDTNCAELSKYLKSILIMQE